RGPRRSLRPLRRTLGVRAEGSRPAGDYRPDRYAEARKGCRTEDRRPDLRDAGSSARLVARRRRFRNAKPTVGFVFVASSVIKEDAGFALLGNLCTSRSI